MSAPNELTELAAVIVAAGPEWQLMVGRGEQARYRVEVAKGRDSYSRGKVAFAFEAPSMEAACAALLAGIEAVGGLGLADAEEPPL